ncbi:hypothetical protein BASA83_012639 [Batrachochytrium salamandrivorans]|nr:hypothetical protein BASA83_012639 [Batrachochytrium salamandrivorans]
MQAVFPTLSLATFERPCRVPASVPVRCVIFAGYPVKVVQLLVDADYVSAFTRIITSLDATIVKSFKAWIPRPEAADKDKLAAISSFATLEAATAEAAKIRVQTPDFSISTLETVPKESLPVKKATEKEPAAPAVDPPSDTGC